MKRGAFLRSLIGLPALVQIAPKLVEGVSPVPIHAQGLELLEFSMVDKPLDKRMIIGTSRSRIVGKELICDIQLSADTETILKQLKEAECQVKKYRESI